MRRSVAELRQNSRKIRVLAADSTRMSSQLLAEALAQEPHFEVAAIEAHSSSIAEIVADRKPNVLLLSAALDGSPTAGFETTRQVHAASAETKIIILMDAAQPNAVIEAFRSGAHGIFSRTESAKVLAKCVRSVHEGQVWANSAELRYLLHALRETPSVRMVDHNGDAVLSKREHDVVECVAEGLSNREIAKKLKLTEHTVKNYLFRIFDKLGVSSRVEVVLYAFSSRGMSAASGRNPVAADGLAKTPLPAETEKKKQKEPVKDLARRAQV
jgi:DNA-binding NarL/FixJ family response regulator